MVLLQDPPPALPVPHFGPFSNPSPLLPFLSFSLARGTSWILRICSPPLSMLAHHRPLEG